MSGCSQALVSRLYLFSSLDQSRPARQSPNLRGVRGNINEKRNEQSNWKQDSRNSRSDGHADRRRHHGAREHASKPIDGQFWHRGDRHGQRGTHDHHHQRRPWRSVTISRMATSSVNFAFHYGINLPVTLAPGQAFSATIMFKPSAVQAYTGWVEFIRSTGATSSISLNGMRINAISGPALGTACGRSCDHFAAGQRQDPCRPNRDL